MSTAPGRPTLYIERSQSREEEESPVRAFYRHKSILVTNPHEFSCKLLILKLLQTCDVTYIFVLLRPKKTKSLSEMYEEYIGSELFSYVGNTKLLEKVVPVAAFQTLPALGLDSRDLRLLLANVSIVFHSTDTSDGKLNRPLKSAANSHLNVTKNVVELSTKMSHLVSFVYVSTLNASYTEGFLEEEVYPLKSYFYKLDADAFWTKIKDMDARYVEKIKPTFLGKHRNTYSFSMALSENLVWDKKASLKHAAIVRPSCLSAGHSSPDHGWFDNIQLPTSLMTVHSMGLVRAVNEDANKILPIVPGDMLANGLINIGWYIANKTSSNCLVYNFSSDESNGVSVGQIQRFASDNFYKFPSLKAIREPVEPKPQNVLMYKMNRIVSEIMFAYFFDFLLICTGRSPMLVDMMKKMHQSMTEISAYYFRDSHKFSVINLKRLADSLSDEDKIMFNCDLSQISWPEHFADCYMRFRRNVLKETDDNVSDAIKRVYHLKKVYTTMKYVAGAAVVAMVAMSGHYVIRMFG